MEFENQRRVMKSGLSPNLFWIPIPTCAKLYKSLRKVKPGEGSVGHSRHSICSQLKIPTPGYLPGPYGSQVLDNSL